MKYKYKIDGLLLRFLVNYLKNRKQQVVIGNSTSSSCNVNSGVPQGSIVGPILFVLFINDISENLSVGTNIALYADDTKMWREIHSNRDQEILQNDIFTLQNWAANNKMKFHPSKCHILPVSRKRIPPLDKRFHYYLDGNNLGYCTSENDLGVLITSKLNFTDQCNKLYSKANSRLALLKRTCHFVKNREQKRKLYLTMQWYVAYLSIALWSGSHTTRLQQLNSKIFSVEQSNGSVTKNINPTQT